MISAPSSLTEWFVMATLATEPASLGGMGITLTEFSAMTPWNFEILTQMKREQREKLKKK